MITVSINIEAPQNVKAIVVGDNNRVSWDAVKNASYYIVYRRDNRGFLQMIATDVEILSWIDDSPLENALKQNYYVV